MPLATPTSSRPPDRTSTVASAFASGTVYCVDVALDPGTYVLGVNLATVVSCVNGTSTSYTLSVTGGPAAPVLQGYNVYRAPMNGASELIAFVQEIIHFGSIEMVHGMHPTLLCCLPPRTTRSASRMGDFGAQWLACAFPCQLHHV